MRENKWHKKLLQQQLSAVSVCLPVYYAPEPMAFRNGRVAADGIKLIRDPDNQYYIESSCCIIEELRHDGLHA